MISYDDFQKVDIRVGTVTKVESFPQARRPAYQVWVNFGEELGIKKSSAQITKHYDMTQLVGKQVLGVVNFPPKQIGPFWSEVLILGLADDHNQIVLVSPDQYVPNGGKLH